MREQLSHNSANLYSLAVSEILMKSMQEGSPKTKQILDTFVIKKKTEFDFYLEDRFW